MNIINDIVSKVKFDSELKEDVYKIGTMLAVSRVLKDGSLKGLDNNSFLYGTAYTLSGFIVYHLFVKDMAKKVQVNDPNLQKIIDLVIKIGTIVTVPTMLKGKQVNIYSISYIISGFIANAFFKDCLNLRQYVEDPTMKKVVDDIVLAFFTTVIPIIVRGGRLTPKSMKEVGIKAAGFGFYDYFLA